MWRLAPAAGLLVGGVGRAARLRAASLLPDSHAVAAVAAAEAELMAEANQAHRGLLARLAQRTTGATADSAWEVVTIDVDGCDLAPAPRTGSTPEAEPPATVRIPWSASLRGPEDVRREWARLAA